MKPEHAIDGDPKTRWGSAHKDGEWIQLDLGKAYKVTTVELDWENARVPSVGLRKINQDSSLRKAADFDKLHPINEHEV